MQNTLPTDAIATALLGTYETLKAEIADRIRRDFAEVVEKFNLGNGRMVQPFGKYSSRIERIMVFANDRGYGNGTQFTYSTEIDAEKVERVSSEEAAAVLLAWHKKIVGKVGAVESATLRNGGANYTLDLAKDGRSIRIDQNIVWKVSSRGNWFAQFPARIYVDGKFTSEAQFKAMFAA